MFENAGDVVVLYLAGHRPVHHLLTLLQIFQMDVFILGIQSRICITGHEILQHVFHVTQDFCGLLKNDIVAEVGLFLFREIHQHGIDLALNRGLLAFRICKECVFLIRAQLGHRIAVVKEVLLILKVLFGVRIPNVLAVIRRDKFVFVDGVILVTRLEMNACSVKGRNSTLGRSAQGLTQSVGLFADVFNGGRCGRLGGNALCQRIV